MLEYISEKYQGVISFIIFTYGALIYQEADANESFWYVWVILLIISICALIIDPAKGIKSFSSLTERGDNQESWSFNIGILCLSNLFTIIGSGYGIWIFLMIAAYPVYRLTCSFIKLITTFRTSTINKNEERAASSIVLIMCLMFIYPIYLLHSGNEIIGSMWSKQDFFTEMYVLIKNDSSEKAELGVAELFVHRDLAYFGKVSWNCESSYISIESVRLPNGKVLTFDGCCIIPNSSEYCSDEGSKNYWDIELTNNKPKKNLTVEELLRKK